MSLMNHSGNREGTIGFTALRRRCSERMASVIGRRLDKALPIAKLFSKSLWRLHWLSYLESLAGILVRRT